MTISIISQVIWAEMALWKTRQKHLSMFCFRLSLLGQEVVIGRVPLRWGSAFLSQLPSLPRDPCPCGPASSPLNHLLEVSKGLTV